MSAAIQAINALAELERIKWSYEPQGDSEVRVKCPVHGDNTPSAAINIKTNLWFCHSCKAKGDIVTFIAYVGSVTRAAVILELSNRYDLESEKELPQEVVERFHARLHEAGPLVAALHERGITNEMMNVARIGYHEGRLTIPVYDQVGRVVNIRRYLPGAPTRKMLNTRGYSKPRLYRVSDVIENNEVVVCGGEMKALLVGEMLKPYGIGACCVTAGEGTWDSRFSPYFKDKVVYVCMDVDETGVTASTSVADYLAPVAKEIHIVELPLDKDKYPKGDVNDFVGKEGKTVDDLLKVVRESKHYESATSAIDKDLGRKTLALDQVPKPDNVGFRLEFKATVCASDPSPFIVPGVVDVTCSKDQSLCHVCTVRNLDNPRLAIPPSSPAVLDMVNSPEKTQREAMMRALKIPKCPVVKFTTVSHRSAYEVRLTPELEISSTKTTPVVLPAVIVDSRFDLNVPYIMCGKVYPHPKTQAATIVVNSMSETEDSLSTFEPDESELATLSVFRPESWSLAAVEKKLDEVYTDVEDAVTRIFGRRAMHTVIDLTFCSVLFFKMGDKQYNGWMNSLLIGDSSQGKSEAVGRYMEFLNLGEKVDCKNATIAGLLGGLQQMGSNRWFVTWGVIPTHDRRLVVLEELKGASREILAKLTDMRSSGVAEIPKIERRRSPARTRLNMISNPRDGRAMSTYSFGVHAVLELLGSPEDVRRLDVAVALKAGVVDVEKCRRKSLKEPKFSAELHRRLIMFAWTRDPDQIRFESAAVIRLRQLAASLCDRYSEDIPLVDRGTTEQKLAKLAISVAVRTFSCEDGNVVIRECHALWAEKFLDSLYSDPQMGYRDFSDSNKVLSSVDGLDQVIKFVKELRHAKDFVSSLIAMDEITLADVSDMSGLDRDGAQNLLSLLVRKRALKRLQRNGRQTYVKNGDFVSALKKLLPALEDKNDDDEF